jgi:hypothetical protein
VKSLTDIFVISLRIKTGRQRGHKQLVLTHEDELRSVILGDCNAGWQLCLRFEFKQNLVPAEFWYAQHQVINLTTRSTVHRVADMKAYSSVKRRQGDGQLIAGSAGYLIWASTLPG